MKKERIGKSSCLNRISALVFAGFCLPASFIGINSGDLTSAPIFGNSEVVEIREAISFKDLSMNRLFVVEALSILDEVEPPVFNGIENSVSGAPGQLSSVQCACNCNCNCFCHCQCHKC